ncbi:hypothetical protein VTO42DRAFT_7078 [Malbranchea cinnamomea]
MFHPMLRRQATTAGAAVLAIGGIALYPRRTVYAEAPSDSSRRKKPIYDYDDDVFEPKTIEKPAQASETTLPTEQQSPVPPSSSLTPVAARAEAAPYQTPTDQLAAQIRQVRLFLYRHSLRAENAFNDALSRFLHAEARFTSTIASLAPPPESGERLVPGSIYVLVAAMAGSIVSRNRGILLRASTPLAFGTVAAYNLLPITMRNVGDLVWEYEKRVPALAESHVRIRTIAEESWNQAVAHSGYGRAWMESKIGEGREAINEWLKKGK